MNAITRLHSACPSMAPSGTRSPMAQLMVLEAIVAGERMFGPVTPEGHAAIEEAEEILDRMTAHVPDDEKVGAKEAITDAVHAALATAPVHYKLRSAYLTAEELLGPGVICMPRAAG